MSDSKPQHIRRRTAAVSPILGAGLTIAGWVVVANVAWQLVAGLAQALLCEARSRRPLECLPAWSQMGEIGRRSTDTLLALVVHSPADSAAAAIGGVVWGVRLSRRNGRSEASEESTEVLSGPSGPIGIVPSPLRNDDESGDDPTPA
jgi:hypothetical protein